MCPRQVPLHDVAGLSEREARSWPAHFRGFFADIFNLTNVLRGSREKNLRNQRIRFGSVALESSWLAAVFNPVAAMMSTAPIQPANMRAS